MACYARCVLPCLLGDALFWGDFGVILGVFWGLRSRHRSSVCVRILNRKLDSRAFAYIAMDRLCFIWRRSSTVNKPYPPGFLPHRLCLQWRALRPPFVSPSGRHDPSFYALLVRQRHAFVWERRGLGHHHARPPGADLGGQPRSRRLRSDADRHRYRPQLTTTICCA